ncbi:hypothetical protein FOZ62_005410 [Perkinsus olseni]|uniref:Uncharacterized protein n=1 Tax=Perkinsus olseni TaxID=32597 RepID=A0A7J6RWN3_PEROL|nr:hypothetical protein FOZ62_005410 [Perkinsus olseni]
MMFFSPAFLASCAFIVSALRTTKDAAPHETSDPLDMEHVRVYTLGDICEMAYEAECETFPCRGREMHWFFGIEDKAIITQTIECSKHTYTNRLFPGIEAGTNPLSSYDIASQKCYDAVEELHAAMNASSVFSRFYGGICGQFDSTVRQASSRWSITMAESDED